MNKIWTSRYAFRVAFTVAILLRLYHYWMGGIHLPVTTDEALTVLQAKQVLRGDFPLLLHAQPYMFPLEAYWMVPFLWLPRTALGMRVLVVLEGFVYLWLAFQVLRKMGAWRQIWPGALLLLFPSVYLLMNQFAYSQPHNNSAFILSLAAMWFTLSLSDNLPPKRLFYTAVGASFFSVFAFSNAMLSISLILPTMLVAVFRTSFKNWRFTFPGFALGGSFGLLPYAAAILKHPGAHQSVSATYEWTRALGRFWSPMLKYTLPVTSGFNPCLFPDSKEKLDAGLLIKPIFPHLFSVFLIALLLVALVRIIRSAIQKKWLYLGDTEMVFGVTLLSLLLFTLSKRADSSAYRYLVPVVVVFPFAFTALFRAAPAKLVKPFLASIAVVLSVYYAWTGVRLPLAWRQDNFGADVVSAPDLEPAIEYMQHKGIKHCVASHWAAYRINFYTDEEIICSQPHNERFPGWFLPYKDEVDAATNVAYVLTDKIRFLKPSIFERHMRTMGVVSDVYTAGYFRVYSNFRQIDSKPLSTVPANEITLSASHNPDGLHKLLDGNAQSRWQTLHLQETNMWLQIEFQYPVPLKKLTLNYYVYDHDKLPGIHVQANTGNEWVTVYEKFAGKLDKFAFENNHPVYGYSRRTIPFGGEPVQAVRLHAAVANPRFAWTITELTALAKQDKP